MGSREGLGRGDGEVAVSQSYLVAPRLIGFGCGGGREGEESGMTPFFSFYHMAGWQPFPEQGYMGQELRGGEKDTGVDGNDTSP